MTSASGLPEAPLTSGGAFSTALGLRTVALKGISALDGQPYMIRRIDGRQVGSAYTQSYDFYGTWYTAACNTLIQWLPVRSIHFVPNLRSDCVIYVLHVLCASMAAAW